MAVDLDAALADLQAAVAAAIVGTVLGRDGASLVASDRHNQIAESAIIQCFNHAPLAPDPILREASIRLASWIAGSRPHAIRSKVSDPSGTSLELDFSAVATTNGMRSSGAAAYLAPYRVHRAGIISG